MSADIIDGKKFAATLKETIGHEVAKIKSLHSITPCLAVILVGDDPASHVYVRNKVQSTEAAGMISLEFRMADDVSEQELLAKVDELNNDSSVHGILVQLPLPKHIDDNKVIQTIHAAKDVDGFHLSNVGMLSTGAGTPLIPCTPYGSIMLLKDYFGDLSGLNAAVMGRSNIVGKPMAQLLLKENATVTLYHSRSKDYEQHLKNYDIIIAAIGIPEFVKAEHLSHKNVIIDVGINRIERNGKNILVGDVEFSKAKDIVKAITPVPGGVGPMTIACLLRNTVMASCYQHGVEAPNL